MEQLKQLTDQIRDDWNSLKDKLEIDIIENCASDTKLFIIIIMVFCYVVIFSFGIIQRVPIILDTIFPLNGSRPYQFFIFIEYFVSRDKYIQFKLLHEFLIVYVSVTTVGSVSMAMTMYITHLCALLKITSYRLENAIEKNILALPIPKKQYILHQRIVNAIVMHQRSIEYFEFLISIFLVLFCSLIILGIGSMIFDLYFFFQLVSLPDHSKNAFVTFLLIFGFTIYLFCSNYLGQAVMNSGIELFDAVYNGLWYAAPLSQQKMLLFVMQRGKAHLTFTCFGVFVASLDGFVTLASTVISYFMVIYTTQHQ